MSAEKRVRVVVEGRVQGVCFRAETRRAALKLGVSGWVRNLADGRVEALFEGDAASVDAALEWCRQGPALARVSRVTVSALPPGREFSSFEVRYS